MASSAHSEHQLCTLCPAPARYKCPRCATPTCSLTCSRKHKQDTRCTGERDKVQYVPMNAYGWGTMMRDYCYLEDVCRKVGEWGNEIARGGYMENMRAGKPANNARKTAREKKPTTRKSKRELFKAHLEALGVDVELLPTGMERRSLNQSTFDQRSKSPLLTIEIVFYPTTTVLSSPPSPYKLLSHRNSLSTTLLAVLQQQVTPTLAKSQKQKTIPDWIPSIVIPHPEAPECFILPHCYMSANPEFPHGPNIVYYHKLEPTKSLGELLQGSSFVEFPTVHVFDPGASSFCGTVIDKSGSMIRVLDDQDGARTAKRRKLSKAKGLKTVVNLIGGYGSEDECHSEEETENQHITGLATLAEYSGSDDEIPPAGGEAEEEFLDSEDDAASEGDELDPARLLELARQAHSAVDEDILDWGDEWAVDEEQDVGR